MKTMTSPDWADKIDVAVRRRQLSAKERFDVAREIIKHEDGLVNSRITWLQVFQGLLFTAFIAGIGLYKTEAGIVKYTHARPAIALALLTLALLGIIASYVAFTATNAAINQIVEVERWWYGNADAVEFPPIAGHHGINVQPPAWLWSRDCKKLRIRGSHMLLVFVPVWAMLYGLFLWVGS